ncbi:lantibiotic dehydratase C-terminal domain-containing protein [Paraburkholderia rhizosphaerae]|uniref:lantibiotic dehydratase C-terminal domain-containing protein n=1 Tax=Paraburkholderia rhizosphaerae TaxID=480658 RepID=UPI0035E72CC5
MEQSGYTENFTAMHAERHIRELRGARQMLHVEHHFAADSAFAIALIRQLAPGHQFADLRLRVVLDRTLRHLLTVAQHDHFAANRIAFVELVADEQHRHAVRAQIGKHRDQIVDFLLRERRGRFVHDHELRLAGDRACNRDELTGRQRQLFD